MLHELVLSALAWSLLQDEAVDIGEESNIARVKPSN